MCTCTGSKESVGENCIMSNTVAQRDTRNTIYEDRMLRVQYKVVNVPHKNGLGREYLDWKAPCVATRHTDGMPWSYEETARKTAHEQGRVNAELHVTLHACTTWKDIALTQIFDLLHSAIAQNDTAIGV